MAAVVPLMWVRVVPDAVMLCKSDRAFNYHPLNDNGQKAGVEAKAAFCNMVKNNPA